MKKILLIFGTRPEFIKLLPLIIYFKKIKKIKLIVCNSEQHKHLLEPIINFYKIKIDYNLNIFKKNQTLSELNATIFKETDKLFKKLKPNYLIVQGDTSTSFVSALSAFYNSIKIFHIEAGLRTNNIYFPWPEEINRQFISKIAFHHFAPTKAAKGNLINEGYNKKTITLSGNTVTDLLFLTLKYLEKNKTKSRNIENKFWFLDRDKFNILITVHRRENFGNNLKEIFKAINQISNIKNINIILCQHKNPNVIKIKKQFLNKKNNINIISAVNYVEFIFLMQKVDLIMSDSGGIQEEAPSLGKPLIILRDTTERPETIDNYAAVLAKPKMGIIYDKFREIYFNKNILKKMSIKRNLYGNGKAAKLICDKITNLIS